MDQITTIPVDPARLDPGRWDFEADRQVNEGDVAASYSADVIALEGRVRKPFRLNGQLWVSVGTFSSRCAWVDAKAYRLVAASLFTGTPVTYSEKTRIDGGDHARNDPLGFYHGMKVRHGGGEYVLVGPPVCLVGDASLSAPVQISLFG